MVATNYGYALRNSSSRSALIADRRCLQLDLEPSGKIHFIAELTESAGQASRRQPKEFKERAGINRRRGTFECDAIQFDAICGCVNY